MKNQWLVFVVVTGISALAGVAIAGLPDNSRTEASIVVPEITVASTSTTVVEVPATSEAPAEVVNTEPADVAVESTTSVPLETTTTTEPVLARADVVVVAINGAGVGGLANRTREALVDIGYTSTRTADGSAVVDQTVVYFFDGFEREAAELSLDLELDPSRVKPVIESPGYDNADGDQVALYIGRDRS